MNSEILQAGLNAKLIIKFDDIIDIIEERKSYHKEFETIFAERYDDHQPYKPDEEHKLRINLAKSLGLIDKKWKYK